jgi:hypothetical protein
LIDSGDYPCLSFCTSCGLDMGSDELFDRHRVGTHDYTHAEGLRMSPPREDGRRCLTPEEMRAKGWRPYTEEEMLASRRDRRRVGYGIELWHDPARSGRARKAFPTGPERRCVAQEPSEGGDLTPDLPEPPAEPSAGR